MRKLPEFATANGTTTIPLNFDKAQSFFIVFRDAINTSNKLVSDNKNFTALKKVTTLSGAWKVQFDSAWGGPAKPVVFEYVAGLDNSYNRRYQIL